MSIEQLYTAAIRQLAREGRVPANRPQPTARATVLSNRFCGDEVRLETRIEEGLVREIACTVRACVLCEASAEIMRRAMLGRDESSLAQAEWFLCRLADGVPAPPPAGWEELARFEPLRRFRSHLDCVLLPLRALRQLLSPWRARRRSYPMRFPTFWWTTSARSRRILLPVGGAVSGRRITFSSSRVSWTSWRQQRSKTRSSTGVLCSAKRLVPRPWSFRRPSINNHAR